MKNLKASKNGKKAGAPLPVALEACVLRLPDAVHRRVPVDELTLAGGFNRSDLALNPEFKRDIAARGVLVPLIVRSLAPVDLVGDPTYEIFAGARRWTAAKVAGLAEVPVSVYPPETPSPAMLELRLIENLQREGLTALDEARQMQEALASGDYGQGRDAVTALAGRVGKSASHVYSRLRLLKASGPVRAAVESGKLEVSCAELLAVIPDPKQQAKALKELMAGEGYGGYRRVGQQSLPMSFREAREHVRENYSKPLKEAQFDRDDAGLNKAGPCQDCKFRSGNIEGFQSGSPDVCTSTACFAEKTEAHFKNIEDLARKEGRKVLSQQEWERVRYRSDYVKLHDTCYEDAKNRTWRQVLAKGCPPTALARDKREGLVELLAKETAIKAANELGVKFSRPQADYEKKHRAEQKKSRERNLILSKVATAAQCGIAVQGVRDPDRKFCLLLARVALHSAGFDAQAAFWQFHHPDAKAKKQQWMNYKKEIEGHFQTILKSSAKAEEHLRCCALQLWSFGEPFNKYQNTFSPRFLALCEWAGVDLKVLEAKLKKPAPAAKTKTAGGKVGKRESGRGAAGAKGVKSKIGNPKSKIA